MDSEPRLLAIDDWVGLVDLYREAKTNAELWAAKQAEYRDHLLSLLADVDYGTVDGRRVVRRGFTEGRLMVDSLRLKEAYPDIWQGFTKRSRPSHSITLIEPKEPLT